MSSEGLDNYTDGGAADRTTNRFLLFLKKRGPRTAAALGSAFGITGEAARQQLLKLAEEGLVKAEAEPRGVGRPAQVWCVTSKGDARFPDAHAELTVQLIDSVRTVLGSDALDQLIAAREQTMRVAYTEALKGAKRLPDRVARLAFIRNREGYMAESKPTADGFLLVENHCPICAAATACTGFCRSELNLFSELLGPEVEVTREEHILEGARRCAYRIRRKIRRVRKNRVKRTRGKSSVEG